MSKEVSKQELYRRYKERLTQQLESRGVRFWKPKSGTNTIRILPNWRSPNEPFFKQVFAHWNVGENKKKIVCPSTEGRTDCPICTFVEELYKSGLPEDVEQARSLARRERYACNVLDLSGQTEGIAVFEMGPQLFRDILWMFTDGEYGDLDDPETGRPIKIERTGTGLKDTRYSAFPAARPVPLQDKSILENLPNLDEIYKPLSAEEIEKVLLGDAEAFTQVGAEEEEVEVDEETAPTEPAVEFVAPPVRPVTPKPVPQEAPPAPPAVKKVASKPAQLQPQPEPQPVQEKQQPAAPASQDAWSARLRERIQKLREESSGRR